MIDRIVRAIAWAHRRHALLFLAAAGLLLLCTIGGC